MYRFYSNQVIANQAFLDETESNHCKNVLRVKEGDTVEVVDGKGGWWEGVCTFPGKKSIVIELQNPKSHKESPHLLTIALPPTKNPARMEWFVEKATELGVGRIIPLLTKRTEKVYVKVERLNKIIISAGKQSKSLFFPIMEEPTTFDAYFKTLYKEDHQNWIAHCIDSIERKSLVLKDKTTSCHIFIGPEGDFTSEEVEKAQKHGFESLSLGDNRLRVETAALHAVSVYNYLKYV